MSLGKDLAYIRKGLGLSLEEIQSSVKIPLHTLESIENDSIFQSTEHNNIYIRSFIRSYARALKLNEEDIVKALDDVEAGIYQNDLIASDEDRKIIEAEQRIPKEEAAFSLDDVSPPEIKYAPVQTTPNVESVNWADLGKSFSIKEHTPKNWVLLIVAFFILVLVAIGFFFKQEISGLFDFSDNQIVEPITNTFPTPLTDNTTEQDSVAEAVVPPLPVQNETISSSIPTESMSSLQDVLTVAVYAAFDKLEPVRVTSDINWRTNPFWMEQGQAFNFDFNDSLVIRGQYSRMLLLFNGHVINNPAQQYFDDEFDSIVLTRSIFSDTTYLAPAPSEFPYDVGPPDSLVYRIGF
tara:strand:+ start:19672 stop:20724 length:1053 start_codon:yes stop_codon:yes gene_type:complete